MILSEIITIGDELLIGHVVDTNSAWIARQLNELGISVKQITSVSDSADHILEALAAARNRATLIIITGGLGPTRDDVTKQTLCKFFNCNMRFDEESFRIISEIFKSRGREVTDVNRRQAEVPDKCTVLLNRLGTAPGMWFREDGKIYVSLPGVPAEMKGLMAESVLPRLKNVFSLPPIIHKSFLTQGIAESFLSDRLSQWEDELPKNMKLAYQPGAGMVRLRISAAGNDEEELRKKVEEQSKRLQDLVGEYIFGYEHDSLEGIVGRLLREQKKTISTAESCTGGYIAHKLTSIPGSSEYYLGSLVAYSNEVKVEELNVDMQTLEEFGAVSEQVVRTMAFSALRKFHSDYAIACSGIAGPTGGTPEKPVGTVWIAIASFEKTISQKLQLGNFRERVIMETSHHALNLLRKILTGIM